MVDVIEILESPSPPASPAAKRTRVPTAAAEAGGAGPVAAPRTYLAGLQAIAACIDDASSTRSAFPRALDVVRARVDEGSVLTAATGEVDFFTSFGNFDKKWGCGYRNVQMLLSALLHAEPALVLFGGAARVDDGGTVCVPSIKTLQQWLEFAWGGGFDVAGAAQVGAVVGTDEWVGATEAVALLRHQGLKARVVDFEWKGGPRRQRQMGDALVEFAKRHFGEVPVSPETRQTALPLLLQWEGHSVSVVGVARSRGGDESLLVLDPALSGAYLTSRMKRPSTSFTAAAYQFAYLDVAGGVLVGDAEREEGKVVSSELVLVWRDRVEGRGGI
jgi:hypothetical protein